MVYLNTYAVIRKLNITDFQCKHTGKIYIECKYWNVELVEKCRRVQISEICVQKASTAILIKTRTKKQIHDFLSVIIYLIRRPFCVGTGGFQEKTWSPGNQTTTFSLYSCGSHPEFVYQQPLGLLSFHHWQCTPIEN